MHRLSPIICVAIMLVATTGAIADVNFTGDYAITTPQGSMSLALRQSADGTVTGSVSMSDGTCEVNGVVVIDDEDDASVEGTLACAAGGGEFEFYQDDEDNGFYLLVTPVDASGTPRSDLTTLYSAKRADKEEHTDTTANTTPPGLARDSERDPRLVGVWAAQVIMNTPGGNIATQLLMAIREDGTLADLGSRAIGGSDDAGIDTGLSGGGETVAWRTNGDILEVSPDGSQWVQLARFEISGNKLLFVYYDGDRALWYRQ